MTAVWALAALWLGLALVASLLSIWLKISTALSEIVVGTIAQLVIGAVVGASLLGTDESWIKFLSGSGAIVVTFLAGAELDPVVFRLKWKQAAAIGFASFPFPFLGCAVAAHYLLGWAVRPSWLAGVAMSTTSVAVVYAVMIEFGFNTTDYGKTVLAACFVTDLGTVLALGLIFAPFTLKTLVFLAVGVVVFVMLPWLTPRFFRLYGNRPSELETKFLLLCLFAMGALAAWADSEAVLPAYLIGMVLAGTVGKGHALIRRLRTLTFGLLTPFYFIRAGSFVSLPALIAAPAAFIVFLVVKIAAKVVGVYPVTKAFGSPQKEAMYTTLLMSTGLTFGDHLLALWSVARHHHPRAIFSSGRRRDRKRRDPHPHRQRVLSAAASAAETGGGGRNGRPGRTSQRGRVRTEHAMFAKILNANDGSDHADKALSLALRLARQNEAELHMVCVEEIPALPEFIEQIRETTAVAGRRFHRVVQNARSRAEQERLVFHSHVLAGHPVRTIVELAGRLPADLLVIGARGIRRSTSG
jgi:glutathione-regulated potassium-efflux system ancillary protein KefC